MTIRRKLIEVALPLDAINEACKPETENPFLKYHPRSLHVWWARTPLVACRAVLLASLLDDPSSLPEEFPTKETQEQERERLLKLVDQFARWENTSNHDVAVQARAEIARTLAWSKHPRNCDRPETTVEALAGDMPPVVDPFCGRGSISLEAQRLGLRVIAGVTVQPATVSHRET